MHVDFSSSGRPPLLRVNALNEVCWTRSSSRTQDDGQVPEHKMMLVERGEARLCLFAILPSLFGECGYSAVLVE